MPAQAHKTSLRAPQSFMVQASPHEIYNYAATRLVYHHIARAYKTEERYLFGQSRGQKILSRGRQMGQYLVHVGFGISFSQISRIVNRDRTSIAHACETIEDLRDDQKIDKALYFAEMSLTLMMDTLWETPPNSQTPASVEEQS